MLIPSRLAQGLLLQLVNLPWLLTAVTAIDKLDGFPAGKTDFDSYFRLVNARNLLQLLYGQSIFAQHLRISHQKANELVAVLDSLINKGSFDSPSSWEIEISEFESWEIRHHKDEFRKIFEAEIGAIPLFLVKPKGGFDLSALLFSGHKLFPDEMIPKVPDSERDAQEAAKALAFELGTACGFHVFRVTETVLKRYWDIVTQNKNRPKPQTIGKFAEELASGKFGAEKIWETLRQLAKLHRNPIAHPEVILTVEEAIQTLGIARSVIGQMLLAMPVAPPTTGAAIELTTQP